MADRPALTHARVLAIAGPIVLANATVPLIGLVDTAVVGQMGEAAPIGAVGLGAVILSSVYWIFGFLRMGTSGLAAQSHGARDAAGAGAHLVRALAVAFAAAALMIVAQSAILSAAFALAPASDEVERLARAYLSIRIWGAPATIGLYAVTGWLIAVERTRGVLVLQLVQNGLNAALSVWFVLGLGWGVEGVAAASLVAETAGFALGLWMTRDGLRAACGAADLWATDPLKHMARVNSDIMIRSVLLQASFTAFLFLGAGQGDVTLAANQVLAQFLSVTAFALDGFAFAAETLVGQAVGARRPHDLNRAAILTSQWGAGGAVALGAAFWIAGPAIIDLLTTAPEVREAARTYLPWIAAAPVLGIAAWMLDGIFIGATRTAEMRRAMIVSVAVYAAAAAALPMVWGNHGLWAALMVLNVLRGITLAREWPAVRAAAGQPRSSAT